MTETQDLVKGKPTGFSRKTGCPLRTAKDYSRGASNLPRWIIRMVKEYLKNK